MVHNKKKTLPPTVSIVFAKSEAKHVEDPYAHIELSAESLFRYVFDDEAYYHTAGSFNDPVYCKRQLRKILTQFKNDIDHLQASESFIASATHDMDRLEESLLRGQITREKLSNALAALHPIATFLGYGVGSKHKSVEPYFIPSVWQEMLGWTDQENYFANSEVLHVRYRAQIALQLKEQGLTLAEIAAVLNQSGYRIAQLLKLAETFRKGSSK